MSKSKATSLTKAEKPITRTTTLEVVRQDGKTLELQTAEVALGPHLPSALTAMRFQGGHELKVGINEAIQTLQTNAAAIHSGDMRAAESLLISQATALDAIFAEMARKASLNMNQYPQATEIYMRMALRAQSQCRATVETLGALKNPPAVFAKQANIAHNQQINHAPAEVRPTPFELSGK